MHFVTTVLKKFKYRTVAKTIPESNLKQHLHSFLKKRNLNVQGLIAILPNCLCIEYNQCNLPSTRDAMLPSSQKAFLAPLEPAQLQHNAIWWPITEARMVRAAVFRPWPPMWLKYWAWQKKGKLKSHVQFMDNSYLRIINLFGIAKVLGNS